MPAKTRRILANLAALCCLITGVSPAAGVPLPSRNPVGIELPQQRPGVPEHRPDLNGAPDAQPEDELLAMPPLPIRAPPPSLRRPRIASEPLGPAPPPQEWSSQKIAKAKEECARLVSADDFEFETLEPIKKSVCGAPAPVSLEAIKANSKVEIQPSATVNCSLADALKRWINEAVQPRAKDLLNDEIVAITNIASYHCRPRYNDPSQRMSQHAFANALDVSEFITAKGERINPLEHWDGDDQRSKFLKEVHAKACKFFGTVLGPGANAAHRSHFHLDMAKRRHGSYCR